MKNPSEGLMMKGKDINKAFREQANKLRSKWRKVVTGNEAKRIRDHIRETEGKPQYVKLFDKIAFTLGVLNIAACQFFLLNRPEFFWLWYSAIIPVLMLSRFYHFRCMGWQYFMIDFCYFTLILTLVNLFLVYNSPLFFKVCFIYANGPLMVAILIWRNSFIFHDYDKIVSVYIHLLPSMLYYTLRWHSHSNDNDLHNGCFHNNCTTLTAYDYVVATGGYFVWQVLYILKTEVLDKKRLDSHPELLTSLRWMSSDTKNSLAKAILKVLRRVGVFGVDEQFNATSAKTKGVFVMSQLLITVVAFLPTPLFYYSSTAHLLFIVFIFTVTIFNGASFYIEVFSKRYNTKIARIEEMQRIAQEAQTMVHQIATINAQIASTPAVSQMGTPPRSPLRVRSRAGSLTVAKDAADGHEPKDQLRIDTSRGAENEHGLTAAEEEQGEGMSNMAAAAAEALELEAISRDLHATSKHAMASARGLDKQLQQYLIGSSEESSQHPAYSTLSSAPNHVFANMMADDDSMSARSYSNDSQASDVFERNSSYDSNGSPLSGLAESAAAAAGALKAKLRAAAKLPREERTASLEEEESDTLRELTSAVADCDGRDRHTAVDGMDDSENEAKEDTDDETMIPIDE